MQNAIFYSYIRPWVRKKADSCYSHFKVQCNFFLTIVSVATPSRSSALCSGISGWLPRPPFHPPSSNTEAGTRRSPPSGMLWGGWTTAPAKCKIMNKFYKAKSYCLYKVLPTSSFINCANTQSLVSMGCSVTDGQCVPWAAPGLNGWLYRGWRPPHHRQLCPRLTCSAVSPGHWNNKYYKIQTVAAVNF